MKMFQVLHDQYNATAWIYDGELNIIFNMAMAGTLTIFSLAIALVMFYNMTM